jgi:hypothetical protein
MTSPFGRRNDRSRFRGMESMREAGDGDGVVGATSCCERGWLAVSTRI